MSEKKVTQSEFEAFIAAYPRPLEKDVTTICDPPLLSYNDFTLGNWPDSMVAKVKLNEEMKGHPAYKGEPNDYYIKSEAP